MIKAIIFDSDRMLTHGPRFSGHYANEYDIAHDQMTPFFIGPFKDCLIGKAYMRVCDESRKISH